MRNRTQHLIFAVITLVLLVVAGANQQVDCNSEETWSTPSGVKACAVTQE